MTLARAALQRLGIIASVASVGLAGCSAGPSDELPPGLGTSLYALVSTVDGFSFYPPLGPEPTAVNPFVDDLLPYLHVELEATDSAGNTEHVATFDAHSSPALVLLAAHEMYWVNVPAAAYITDPSRQYSFRVTLDPNPNDPYAVPAELGYSDLTDHIFTVLRYVPNLPIGVKLRVEQREAPALWGVSPDVVAHNDGFELTLTGWSFAPDSIAEIDHQPIDTTFVSSEELRAFVPASIAQSLGEHELVVYTPLGGPSKVRALTILDSLGPSISASASSIDFGLLAIGDVSADQAIVVTNDGSEPTMLSRWFTDWSNFDENGDDCPPELAPGESCTVNLIYSPYWEGPHASTYEIESSSDGAVVSIALTGDTLAPPGFTLSSGDAMDMGAVAVGSTATRTITVQNGGTPITDWSITASGTVFSVTHDCGVVLPGGTCTITVSFSPVAQGRAWGQVQVSGAGVGTDVWLEGAGTVGGAMTSSNGLEFLAGPYDFGGFHAIQEGSDLAFFPVTNTRTTPFYFSAHTDTAEFGFERYSVTCPVDYSVPGTPWRLDPGASCAVPAWFYTSTVGTFGDRITLDEVDARGAAVRTIPATSLTARGLVLRGSPGRWDLPFGDVHVALGSSYTRQDTFVTFYNYDMSSPLRLLSITTSGPFHVVHACPPVMAPAAAPGVGSWCNLQVYFDPTAFGDATGQIIITDEERTQYVQLSATDL